MKNDELHVYIAVLN